VPGIRRISPKRNPPTPTIKTSRDRASVKPPTRDRKRYPTAAFGMSTGRHSGGRISLGVRQPVMKANATIDRIWTGRLCLGRKLLRFESDLPRPPGIDRQPSGYLRHRSAFDLGLC